MGDYPLGKNKFTIITPVRNRGDFFHYTIESVLRQTYPEWEYIIVNDGSEDNTQKVIDEFVKKDPRIKSITFDSRKQRAVARNTGMRAATNDWICWLDSDDEYLKTYLEVLNSYMTEDFPGYQCYNFGAIVVRMGYQSVRETQELKEEGDGMEAFPSGGTGAGSFVFHKDCLKEVGYLPEKVNPYLFSDACKEERPEITNWYGGKYLEGGKTLGNPWGDDWYMFYKITRKFKTKALPIAPYVQFVRRNPFSWRGDQRE